MAKRPNPHEAWLTSLPQWPQIAPRGGGITATLVSNHLIGPWLKALNVACLTEADLAHHEPRLVGALLMLRTAVDETISLAKEKQIAISVHTVAHKAARSLAPGLISGEQLSDIELRSILETYLSNQPSTGRVLSKKQFEQWRLHYDECWDRQGKSNLVRCSYSNFLLGEDEKPQFIVSGRENTWLGLARSVYSRYRLAASDVQVPGDGQTILEAEIERACGRLGLLGASVIVALRSLLVGLIYADHDLEGVFSDERTWREAETLTADSENEENSQLVSYARSVFIKFSHLESQGRFLRVNNRLDEAHGYAMKRAWMICFERDRRGEVLSGKDAAYLIDTAIFKGVPSGERHRNNYTLPHDAPVVDSSADQEQLDATERWFAADPTRCDLVRQRDEETLRSYQAQPGLLDIESLLNFLEGSR